MTLDLNPLLIRVDGADTVVYNRDRPRNTVPDTLDAEIVRDAARFLQDGEKMQLLIRFRTLTVPSAHAYPAIS